MLLSAKNELGENFVWAIPLVVLLLLVGLFVWRYLEDRSTLFRWANEHELKITKYSHRYFRRGPFGHDPLMLLGITHFKAVFRVVVTDPTGVTQFGWVQCGTSRFSITGRVTVPSEVIWDANLRVSTTVE